MNDRYHFTSVYYFHHQTSALVSYKLELIVNMRVSVCMPV